MTTINGTALFIAQTTANVTCPIRRINKLSLSREITGKYLFPPLFVIGVIGNVLNLCVLNSKGMRTKTNIFLSAMALSDLCFLIFTLPNEIVTFDYLLLSHAYMSFFVNTRMAWIALVNWFSAASIWIAILVTAERVIAIKAPLRAKFWWKTYKIVITLILIYLSTFLMSCYNFVWLTPEIRHVCGDVYQYSLKTINATEYPKLAAYVQSSLLITPFLVVTIPTILLTLLNSCLLYYLYENRKNMAYATKTPHQQGNELKVACTVSVIVLSFIIFTAPSAFFIIYEAIYKNRSKFYTEGVTMANFLVNVGKSVNFILYCSSSRHFRRRLIDLFLRGKSRNRSNSRISINNGSRRRSTLTSLIELPDSRNFTQWLQSLANKRPSTSNGAVKHRTEIQKLVDPYHRPNEMNCHERRHTHPVAAPHSLEDIVAKVRNNRRGDQL